MSLDSAISTEATSHVPVTNGLGTQRRPSRGAAPFEIADILCSRTDRRGVIESGNSAFRTVSDFDWDAMVGAPHKLVRHPDMPQGAFYLMWQTIQSGEPIGLYAKNRACDGLYYWVFAVVAPLSEGYLSVRIKPTTPLLQTIDAEYASLRAKERTEGLSPEESAALLLERLKDLGFSSYAQFMLHALYAEVEARNEQLGRPTTPGDARLIRMGDLLTEIRTETDALIRQFDAIRGVPANMRIAASRLEASGGPVSAISQNYDIMCDEIWTHLASFGAGQSIDVEGELTDLLSQGRFLLMAVHLQDEVIEQMNQDTSGDASDIAAQERQILKEQSKAFRARTTTMLTEIDRRVMRFSNACADLRRLIAGLDMVRVMCKVESGRLQNRGEGLASIIEQLDSFQSEVSSGLERVERLSQQVRRADRPHKRKSGGRRRS